MYASGGGHSRPRRLERSPRHHSGWLGCGDHGDQNNLLRAAAERAGQAWTRTLPQPALRQHGRTMYNEHL
eukprot:6193106-Pleurochrysis_carterae.AAC.1